MTLRYEGRHPVGLDWSAISTSNDPEIWTRASLAQSAAKPKEDTANPKPGRQRLARAVEHQIIRLYRDEKLSAKEVGREAGVQPATVFKVLARNGVPARSKAEGMAISKTNRAKMERRAPDGKFL